MNATAKAVDVVLKQIAHVTHEHAMIVIVMTEFIAIVKQEAVTANRHVIATKEMHTIVCVITEILVIVSREGGIVVTIPATALIVNAI
jgi:hypothetical protein